MNRGDIVHKYRKNNSRNADFYVVLGKKRNAEDYINLLGFYKDGTAVSTYRIYYKDLEQNFRVVGHTDFIFDITKQIELITVDKKDLNNDTKNI